MIAWLTGVHRQSVGPEVPIAEWSEVLEHELRAELCLGAEQTLALEFHDLPTAIVPSDFETALGGDAETCAQVLLESLFNFVTALRLPAAITRLLFVVSGCITRPVLVRRTARLVDVAMLALERHPVPAAAAGGGELRTNRCRVTCRRTGALALEELSSSRWDLRQPSAGQCIAALLAEHFRAVDAERLAVPLISRLRTDRGVVTELLYAVERERLALDNSQAITGLLYIYLCDASNIAVCNELIEEATRFAERLDDTNGAEELARVAALAPCYAARLRACTVAPQQLVQIIRSVAKLFFGADIG